MLLDLVKLKDKYNMGIKGVYHIGAHFGQENGVYKTLKVENKIFFEPLIHTYNKLVKNLNGDGICVNTALGSEVGKVELIVESANQGMSSSILQPELHTLQYPHIKFEGKLEVNITTLDTHVKSEGIDVSNFNFINIDVQGYELEVFKGAKETLNSIDYIMTEVNRDEVYSGCARIEELDNFLSGYGFERVETTWDGHTWGDALYIKCK